MKSNWKKYLLLASLVVLGGVFVYIIFETFRSKNAGFESKTLWDWMELLLIPFFLAGGALYLERSERAIERRIAGERIKEERRLAEERANLDREIALDRQQEAALQTYFDRMTELLLKEKLRTTKKAEVRDVARTRTISIMRVLDNKRKNLVIQFLREAKLITDNTSILSDADMGGMDLQSLNLYDIYLHKVDLQYANLQKADLRGAILRDAILWSTDFRSADLRDTDLHAAEMQGADLREAKVTNEQLERAKSLEGTTMPDGTKHE